MLYYPNCTLPDTPVSYVGSPNIRSTLDILWSSLATIIACTYTVLHLNIPEQRQDRDRGFKGDLKWGAKRLLTSMKWSTITVLAPEYILSKYAADFGNAKYQLGILHRHCPETKGTWTLTHMLFADMGGFLLQCPESQDPDGGTESRKSGSSTQEMTDVRTSAEDRGPTDEALSTRETANVQNYNENVHNGEAPAISNATAAEVQAKVETTSEGATTVRAGANTDPTTGNIDAAHTDAHDHETDGNTNATNDSASAASEQGSDRDVEVGKKVENISTSPKLWHLHAYSLRHAIEDGIISSKLVTAEEISDRSKSDLFTKALTVVQILYFVVGVFFRAGQDLPISQLELGVSGFVACSAVTYCFAFFKPKAVITGIVLGAREPENVPKKIKDIRYRNIPYTRRNRYPRGTPIRNDELPGVEMATTSLLMGGTVTSILLGAIHLGGWNFSFPTVADKWLWRSSALLTTGLLPLYGTTSFFAVAGAWLVRLKEPDIPWRYKHMFNSFWIALYALTRLVLIVEMFRCLFYLPPEAFVATWTVNIPHIG